MDTPRSPAVADGLARIDGTAAAPSSLAVVDAGRSWSWRVLRRATRTWAARLERAGLAPGRRLALVAADRADTVALVLAARAVGAAVVPLDPDGDPRILAHAAAEARAVACSRAHAPLAGRLAPLSAELLVFEQAPDLLAEDFSGGPAPNPRRPWLLLPGIGPAGPSPAGTVLDEADLRAQARALPLDAGDGDLVGLCGSLGDPRLLVGGALAALLRGAGLALRGASAEPTYLLGDGEALAACGARAAEALRGLATTDGAEPPAHPGARAARADPLTGRWPA